MAKRSRSAITYLTSAAAGAALALKRAPATADARDMMPLSRVLYVDDEPAICRVFARLFEREGSVQITTRSSAGQAVHVLGSQPFDVVVSDLTMNGMDGVELLSYAK